MIDRLEKPRIEVGPEVIKDVANTLFGVCGNIRSLGGEKDHNFLMDCGHQSFLLKLCNPSEPDELVDFQVQALQHIARVDPGLAVPRSINTIDGRGWGSFTDCCGLTRNVRLLSFLPGVSLGEIELSNPLLRSFGETVARIDRALQGYFHSSADYPLVWDLKRANLLAPLIDSMEDRQTRLLINAVFQRFSEFVVPRIPRLRAQVIHNDITFHNAVVDENDSSRIAGIYDFGDMIYAPLIQEFALTAAEIAIGNDRPEEVSALIVAGIDSITPIQSDEFELLPCMMSMRLAMAIVLAQHVATGDARAHLPGLMSNTLETLQHFWKIGEKDFVAQLKYVCRAPVVTSAGPQSAETCRSIFKRRQSVLGNADVVSYQKPVHLVQGEGVSVRDIDGKTYIDAYNNVPHVGHCHPHVVAAINRQTALLNTNTRYLHNAIVDYSERLTKLLPEELNTCYFVSSGSEANDLAWRIAQSWSGGNIAAAMGDSYHGITDFSEKISLYAYDETSTPKHVIALDPPDNFRGQRKHNDDQRGMLFAQLASDKLDQYLNAGKRFAAVFVDGIMSSSGIILPPPGFSRELATIAHRHDGLYVADEVQSGFGRLGKHLWGFEFGDFVPDIVTFGKPIANGYPMGLVITKKEIADRFSTKHDFFSTTGGNPVACCAAMAVLDVMEEENLMKNAFSIGIALKQKISALATQYPQIGDVRGSGLFIGVDLVANPQTLSPDRALADRVINCMKENGVLVGTDGPGDNVIKIRPPMCFDINNAEKLVECLSGALSISV